MSDASLPVQKAIYARLSDALTAPVFDHVPQDQTGEYVVIGEGTEIPADTKTHNGVEHQVEVHVYSDKRGKSATKTILGQVYTDLHRQPITVDGFSATMLQFDSEVMFEEPNGFRGVARYRFFTTEL